MTPVNPGRPLDFLDRAESQTKVRAKLKDQPVPKALPELSKANGRSRKQVRPQAERP